MQFLICIIFNIKTFKILPVKIEDLCITMLDRQIDCGFLIIIYFIF